MIEKELSKVNIVLLQCIYDHNYTDNGNYFTFNVNRKHILINVAHPTKRFKTTRCTALAGANSGTSMRSYACE